jgi:hypothetical protein
VEQTMITFGDIVTKVLQRLALVEGLDAQIYAEPRIQLAIQHKFDLIFREYWIPEYTTYQEPHTLDGTHGFIIDNEIDNKVKDWRDVHSVFHEGSHKPMPIAPMSVRDIDITYPSLRPGGANQTRLFRVVPATTIGVVYVTYRTKPDDFEEDSDEIFMDTQLLLLGTCWDVLEDDGTNPGASDKFKMLFQDALSQFNRQQHNIPLDTISSTRSVVNRWT